MPKALQITSTLHITPLIDIHNNAFAQLYRDGLWWSLFGKGQANTPMTDSYLIENLKQCAADSYFDGQHDHWLPMIGFYIGRIHGGILSPQTGELRPDVTAPVMFHDQDAARGYSVGREWYFYEAQPQELAYTDGTFLARVCELVLDLLEFDDDECTWYYTFGCVLGELSGNLFPETLQESQEWETRRQKWREEYARQTAQASETEPVMTQIDRSPG